MPRSSDSAPLLIDRFLSAPLSSRGAVPRRTLEFMRSKARVARTLVLNDNAAVRFANVVREIPDLIVQQQEFARAPYETCWIEFPFHTFYGELTQDEPDSHCDHTLGYLIHQGTAYTVSGGTLDNPTGGVEASPFVYHLHQPWPMQDQLDFCQKAKTSRMQLDPFLWGKSFLSLGDESRRALRDHNTCECVLREGLDTEETMTTLVQATSGELRNIIALLLLMNRPSITTVVRDVAARRSFVGGKSRPFMAHSLVTIDLDPKPTLLRLGTHADEQTPRRRHEVKGHYCHNQAYWDAGKKGCVHNLIADAINYPDDDPNDPDHWVCEGCGGRRWWRNAHPRGTAEVGFVNKMYQVTAASPDEQPTASHAIRATTSIMDAQAKAMPAQKVAPAESHYRPLHARDF